MPLQSLQGKQDFVICKDKRYGEIFFCKQLKELDLNEKLSAVKIWQRAEGASHAADRMLNA